MDFTTIKQRIQEAIQEFLITNDAEKIIKNAYRIKNLLSSLKDIAEIEKMYSEQTYEGVKKLVITELITKYPHLRGILEAEL